MTEYFSHFRHWKLIFTYFNIFYFLAFICFGPYNTHFSVKLRSQLSEKRNILHVVYVINFFQVFLISSFRRVQNVVCFLLGDSPASDLYMPTFRNTLSVPSSKAGVYVIYSADDVYENRNMLRYICTHTLNSTSIVVTDCSYFFIVAYIYIYIYIHSEFCFHLSLYLSFDNFR